MILSGSNPLLILDVISRKTDLIFLFVILAIGILIFICFYDNQGGLINQEKQLPKTEETSFPIAWNGGDEEIDVKKRHDWHMLILELVASISLVYLFCVKLLRQSCLKHLLVRKHSLVFGNHCRGKRAADGVFYNLLIPCWRREEVRWMGVPAIQLDKCIHAC